MTKCILETTGVEFHEGVLKRARVEAKGKAEEGGLQEGGDDTTGEHRILGVPAEVMVRGMLREKDHWIWAEVKQVQNEPGCSVK